VVAFPPHLGEAIKDHLKNHAQWGRDGLLFPTTHGEQYRAPTLHQAYFRKAREAAGRPDLRFHDLRHTGATLAAASGATLAELMQRLGHTTVSAALAYQHAAQGSDKRIADKLSQIAMTSGRS
jgi:integrase